MAIENAIPDGAKTVAFRLVPKSAKIYKEKIIKNTIYIINLLNIY